MPDNSITLVGNLTRDPELRFTNSGRAQATLGLAVNRRWRNSQSGEWEEQASFFNIVCWGDLGENVAHSVNKGARVIVNGRLEQRSWQTEGGDKRSVVEVVADEVGPSLRWATATVEKNERKSGDEFGGGSGGRPISNEEAVGAAGAAGAVGATTSSGPTSSFGDEEPF